MSFSTIKTLKVVSENGVQLYNMTEKDFNRIQLLMLQGVKKDEYPIEINTILAKYQPIEVNGTISTEGDGWGWWDRPRT